MLLLLLLVSQRASGVEVKVYEGVESVLLPCQVPQNVSNESTAAVWDREELNIPTVHVRLQSGDDYTYQNPRYTNRTSMRADALQTGDLSLTLRNPTGSDSGTYTCTTRKDGEDQIKSHLQLKVTERPPPPPPSVLLTVLPAVLVPVVLVVVLAVIYLKCKGQTSREDPEVEMVEVIKGEDSVVLPFITEDRTTWGVKVAWTHNGKNVHVYKRGNNQPLLQDQDYRDRTEMNEDPLRSKDLSLTLKDPQLSDRGVYTCTVCNKCGHVLLQKSVTLSVRVLQTEMVEVTQGQRSVLLPFKITDELPPDVKVQWRLTHPEDKMVLMYDSSQNHPLSQDQVYRYRTEMKRDPLRNKDFSLTLKDPKLTDSGVYTCTVCNKDGIMLLQKVVTLSVRGA
ncbi:uncharacterized protein LOC115775645 [Archocentrus centrarchus]|uniref:uncharacterized protein LOC115775645 n=1 Tax=Archocentrus centrarchus TaxID=63155 RepID=UPI0011E9E01C|nr:uncharacterized protein LOC115775645 [Archocentrus centrarchus]